MRAGFFSPIVELFDGLRRWMSHRYAGAGSAKPGV